MVTSDCSEHIIVMNSCVEGEGDCVLFILFQGIKSAGLLMARFDILVSVSDVSDNMCSKLIVSNLPHTRDVATHVRDNCAKLLSISGSNISGYGCWCRERTCKANIARGPHSLE